MRYLITFTALTTLILGATAAEAAKYYSPSRYVSSSTVHSSSSNSAYYRRGNFQAINSPYHLIGGHLFYSRGNFQGYVYRRR